MCNSNNNNWIHCESRNYYYKERYKFRTMLIAVISIDNNNLVINKINEIEIITLSGQKSNLKTNKWIESIIYIDFGNKMVE